MPYEWEGKHACTHLVFELSLRLSLVAARVDFTKREKIDAASGSLGDYLEMEGRVRSHEAARGKASASQHGTSFHLSLI